MIPDDLDKYFDKPKTEEELKRINEKLNADWKEKSYPEKYYPEKFLDGENIKTIQKKQLPDSYKILFDAAAKIKAGEMLTAAEEKLCISDFDLFAKHFTLYDLDELFWFAKEIKNFTPNDLEMRFWMIKNELGKQLIKKLFEHWEQIAPQQISFSQGHEKSIGEVKPIRSVTNQLNALNDQPVIKPPKIRDSLLARVRKLALLFIVIVGGCYMVAYVVLGFLTAMASLFLGFVASGIVWVLFELVQYNKRIKQTRSDEWVSDFDSRMNKLSFRLEQKKRRWGVILLLILGFWLYCIIALVISHL